MRGDVLYMQYEQKQNYIITGDNEIDGIISKQVRKMSKIAKKNAIESEDLHQEALLVLLDYLQKEGLGMDDVDKLTLHQKMAYRMVLQRRLTEIANQSTPIKKDGKTYYLSLLRDIREINNINENEIQGRVQEDTVSHNQFSVWFLKNREQLLTNKQNKILTELLDADMHVQTVADANGVSVSAVNQTINRITDRVLEAYREEYEADMTVQIAEQIDALLEGIVNTDGQLKYIMVNDYIVANMYSDHIVKVLYADDMMGLIKWYPFYYEDELGEFVACLKKYRAKIENNIEKGQARHNRQDNRKWQIIGDSTTVMVDSYGCVIALDQLN